jgi:hypothetical protein
MTPAGIRAWGTLGMRIAGETRFTAARRWAFRDTIPSVAFRGGHGWAPDGATRMEAEFREPELRLMRALRTAPSAATAGMEPTP